MKQIYFGDCCDMLASLVPQSVDLIITSPPYDNLRDYNGSLHWNESVWQRVLRLAFASLAPGAVMVWVVADATVQGSETGTSFRQALYAMEVGFRLHDTMIWNKGAFTGVGALRSRYAPVFEYMFVFSKGQPKTFHPIKDRRNIHAGSIISGNIRQADGSTRPVSGAGVKTIAEFGQRFNVWDMPAEKSRKDTRHPAPFPLRLARDHVLSWSNPLDLVVDPFMGSGTTGVACAQTGRIFVGSEKDVEYHAMAQERIALCGHSLLPLLPKHMGVSK